MNRVFYLLILLVGLISTAFSQSTNLNNYSYIVVPTKFDFLHEEDQFQINSMTKFFLEKNGFNALFDNEVPEKAARCDGLLADVIKSSGLVYTKLEVSIKDCKGNELYRSTEGKSKFKHYKKAYQDALRKAFLSFKTLNVDQPDMIEHKNGDMTDEPLQKETGIDVISDVPLVDISDIVSETKSEKGSLPKGSYSTFSNNNSFFLLRKNKNGYLFYEETKKGDLILIGNFVINKDELIYTRSDGNSYDVVIDELGNIVIYIEGNPVVYWQLDQ